MHRIDTANAVTDLFGAGKNGFGPGNPATNTPATFMNHDWCNAVQEELAGVVEANSALEKGDRGQLLKALRSMFLRNDQVIDRTGLTATAVLDRFDVVHKYRCDRSIMGAGVLPTINVTTGLVPGGTYKMTCVSAAAAALRDFNITLRPNATSYAGQFIRNCIVLNENVSSAAAVQATALSNFFFDTFGGSTGSDGAFEMTLFVEQSGRYKKILCHSGDTSGYQSGYGAWINTTTPWNTVGLLSVYTELVSASQDYFIEINVRRIA